MTAENGADALAVYVEQRESISLVLTDMAMPYLDGPSMIRALRKIDRNVKIVGSSGLADERRVEEVGDVGMEAFLSKPYTAETLLKTLSETLG